MLQASFSAKLGALAQQKRMDTTANNLANVSTTGFKARTVSFKDTLYTNMINPDDPYNGQANNLQRGTGVLVSGMNYRFTPGAAEHTQVGTDFFIEGEGFFTVRSSQGEILYTRDGSFGLSSEADGRYLVTGEGYYVLDDQQQRIRIPEGPISELSINDDGGLSMGRYGNIFATIQTTSFPNPYGLLTTGNNCYRVSEASGAPVQGTGQVVQGYLEMSNVDMVSEMTNLIRTQRAFSFASRALTTADEMQAIANNLRT